MCILLVPDTWNIIFKSGQIYTNIVSRTGKHETSILKIYFCRKQYGGHKNGGEFNSNVETTPKCLKHSLFWKIGLAKDMFGRKNNKVSK